MIDRKISAVLQVETAHVCLPDDLRDRIQRKAAQPVRRPPRLALAAAAALLVLPLVGFAARQIWVAQAGPAPAAKPAQRPTRAVDLAELGSTVDFKVKLPAYLPSGMTLFSAILAGDSTRADASLRVVEIAWVKDGAGTISVDQWRDEQAAAFPPGHPFPAVLNTEPWHKTLQQEEVDIGGPDATLLRYLISGSTRNRVYWHADGINYAVDAHANFPVSELLKVARSLE